MAFIFLGFLLFSSLFVLPLPAALSTLSGRVADPAGLAVQGAQVSATHEDSRLVRRQLTSPEGRYVFAEMPPGRYRVEVSAEGFRTAVRTSVFLHVAGRVVEDFTLTLGERSERVEVAGQASLIERDSAVVETLVERQFVQNLPLNGRSFQSLLELTPGVVIARATISNPGQISINGQRTNANYFMVDGVAANVAASFTASYYQQAAGTLPGLTALGGTNGLVTVDALEEFRVQTSTYAPEYGRMPGGQISLVTRSGNNLYTGALFNYFRNEKLDANDWFNNARGLRRQALRQNQFGGVFGGPVWLPRLYNGRDRTFFFVSYEGQRLVQPQDSVVNVIVPSLEARQRATGAIASVLRAFPEPNSPALPGDPPLFGRYIDALSFPSRFDAVSARLDHRFGPNLNTFVRWNRSPSSFRQFVFANQANAFESNLTTVTGGLTWSRGPSQVNDLRWNWSASDGEFNFEGREIGGAVLPPPDILFPPGYGNERISVNLNLWNRGGLTTSLTQGRSLGNQQRQINLVDTFSWVRGAHQVKFGVDWRRLAPVAAARERGISYVFDGVERALTGLVNIQIQALAPRSTFYVHSFSSFLQDVWRIHRRLSLTLGARYELNPPPSGERLPYSFTQVDDLLTTTLAPPGVRQWDTAYTNIAPRLGLAYQASQRLDLVVRTGFGVFYDTGLGQALRGFSSFPYNATRILNNVAFPVNPAQLDVPFNVNPPYSAQFHVFPRNFRLPYTMQYNFSVEKGLGRAQTISVSYVGSGARQLLRTETVRNIPPNQPQGLPTLTFLNPSLFASPGAFVAITRNAANSNYNALQAQFQRRMEKGLAVLASYTWAKSLDNASDESSYFLPGNVPVETIFAGRNWGPSDFDIRQTLTGAVSWELPRAGEGLLGALTRGWGLDSFVRFRSATPLTPITQVFDAINFIGAQRRLDLVGGVPLYLSDSNVAGGKRLNPAAFAVPAPGRQGSLGRNAIRAFGAQQFDFSLRREFPLAERARMEFRGEMFNAFNHPNFSDFDASYGFALFGTSQSMLNRGLGRGGTQGGLNPLYQIGGPRSVQLSLRFKF